MAIRIKAAPGHRVRDEQSNLLPPEGVVLEAITPYWVRRLNDAEIVVEDVKATAARSGKPDQDR